LLAYGAGAVLTVPAVWAATASPAGAAAPQTVAAALPASASADDQYLSYSGTATARHSAKFLYAEHHILKFSEGRLAERVVLYTCRDGSPFARKTVSYVDPFAPDFLLEIASTGMREGVRTVGKERSVFFRGDGRDPEKTSPLPPIRGLVADAGFDEFVRAHWHDLMSGRSEELHFLVPSRLEEIGFQVQHLRSETEDGISAEVFRLKLAGFWGWVLPGIDVSYSADDHVLMRYDGLSDLRDASGDNFQTQITFPPNERAPASAASMEEARQAKLAPCR
jgi:hypothetical protein